VPGCSPSFVPTTFYDDPRPLEDYILGDYDDLDMSPCEARDLVGALPRPIRSAPCFHFRPTGVRNYEYGKPWCLPDERTIIGSRQVIPVKKLISGVRAVVQHLPRAEREGVLQRLEDRERHAEVLAELAPLGLARGLSSAAHAVAGNEGRTVDWHLTWRNSIELLLEVKSRIFEIIDRLPQTDLTTGTVPAPQTEPERLFRGVERKFARRPADDCLQGVWVECPVKQRKRIVDEHFAEMDPRRLHLAILWSGNISDGRAYLLCRDEVDGSLVLDLFGLRHSEQLVF
jgi:hypothetical protein